MDGRDELRLRTFPQRQNLLNVARQAAPIVIVGVGMTLVMATAGIDLSVGSIVAVVSVVSAAALSAGLHAGLVIPGVILLGAALGAVNGALVVIGVPACIVTLATLVSYRGLAFVLSNGYATPITDEIYLWFGRGALLGLNAASIIALLVPGARLAPPEPDAVRAARAGRGRPRGGRARGRGCR